MKEGTFLVTNADDASAVLQDVRDSQIHTLADNPGVETGEIVVAALEPDPPMEVAWRVTDLREQYTVPVERSPEPPTQQARDVAAEQSVGDLSTRERAGEGEVHILTVPPEETENAAADVVGDEETVARAARLGVERVEVRAADGVVSVRYLP
ncbi:DUF5812 family protein [Halorientalis litorea]|jgi:hypothetical protein|uniref:DUF5812 family protein n=1 Tax=Halorientalis litorea TaxID=2931977 RepID=UPI001FF4939F|nr:DUF5812 family protein [Halorientalis litorea]